MAIIDVSEINERSGTLDKDKQTYTRTFLVETNNSADDPADVLAAISISYGSAHPSDIDAFCKSISVNETDKRAGGGSFYTVVASYDTEVPDPDEGQNPLDEPAQYRWSAVASEETVDEDIAGDPVHNSAKDPFDPPVTRQVASVQLEITKNVATFDGSLALNYVKRVNSSAFQGGAIGHVFCDNISASGPNIENDITYWVVTMSFLFDPIKTWQARVLDAGMRQVVGGDRKPILLNGREITNPVPLDGSGGMLDPSANPVWLDFEIYEEANFNSLPIA